MEFPALPLNSLASWAELENFTEKFLSLHHSSAPLLRSETRETLVWPASGKNWTTGTEAGKRAVGGWLLLYRAGAWGLLNFLTVFQHRAHVCILHWAFLKNAVHVSFASGLESVHQGGGPLEPLTNCMINHCIAHAGPAGLVGRLVQALCSQRPQPANTNFRRLGVGTKGPK